MINQYNITFDTVVSDFSAKGFEVLSPSSDYKNELSKLRVRHSCGEEFSQNRRNLRRNGVCRACEKANRRTDSSVVINGFKDKGFNVLDIENYKNNQTKLQLSCIVCGSHQTATWNQVRHRGCPLCYEKMRYIPYQEVKSTIEAKHSNYVLLTQEADYTDTSMELVGYCDKGHKFEKPYQYLLRNNCKECGNEKKQYPYDEFKKVLEHTKHKLLTPEDYYKNRDSKVDVICPEGHTFKTDSQQFVYFGQRCPICAISKEQRELVDFIEALGFSVLVSNRQIISPLELDIVIPERNLAIEYGALYYHSELNGRYRTYHINKTNFCEDKGYKLLTVFSDEYYKQKSIVLSRIKNALGKADGERIYARKCHIKEIPLADSKEFLDKYHLQKNGISEVRLGAFYQTKLVAVMTFSKPSIAKGSKNADYGEYELNRFCSNPNYHVVGIASKLLVHFERNYFWKRILSYADRRWSNGNVYKQLGFTLIGKTNPNYWYITDNYTKRTHRFAYRKKPDEPKDKTEWQIRQEQGLDRIWDCGSLKFEKYKKIQ